MSSYPTISRRWPFFQATNITPVVYLKIRANSYRASHFSDKFVASQLFHMHMRKGIIIIKNFSMGKVKAASASQSLKFLWVSVFTHRGGSISGYCMSRVCCCCHFLQCSKSSLFYRRHRSHASKVGRPEYPSMYPLLPASLPPAIAKLFYYFCHFPDYFLAVFSAAKKLPTPRCLLVSFAFFDTYPYAHIAEFCYLENI